MPIMVYTYLVWTSVLRSLYMNILRKVTATMQQCYFIDNDKKRVEGLLGGPWVAIASSTYWLLKRGWAQIIGSFMG